VSHTNLLGTKKLRSFCFTVFPYIQFHFSTVVQFSDPFCRRFSQNCEKRQLGSSCLFVRLSAWNKSASTGGIFIKLGTWGFFENPLTKLKFSLNCYKEKGTLHKDLCLISRWITLRMKMFPHKSCRENQNTHFIFNNPFFFFRKLCRLWDNVRKCSTARATTDDSTIMVHALCTLDN
jgi:hypothetical protein